MSDYTVLENLLNHQPIAEEGILTPYGIFIRPNLNRACSGEFYRFRVKAETLFLS